MNERNQIHKRNIKQNLPIQDEKKSYDIETENK